MVGLIKFCVVPEPSENDILDILVQRMEDPDSLTESLLMEFMETDAVKSYLHPHDKEKVQKMHEVQKSEVQKT